MIKSRSRCASFSGARPTKIVTSPTMRYSRLANCFCCLARAIGARQRSECFALKVTHTALLYCQKRANRRAAGGRGRGAHGAGRGGHCHRGRRRRRGARLLHGRRVDRARGSRGVRSRRGGARDGRRRDPRGRDPAGEPERRAAREEGHPIGATGVAQLVELRGSSAARPTTRSPARSSRWRTTSAAPAAWPSSPCSSAHDRHDPHVHHAAPGPRRPARGALAVAVVDLDGGGRRTVRVDGALDWLAIGARADLDGGTARPSG